MRVRCSFRLYGPFTKFLFDVEVVDYKIDMSNIVIDDIDLKKLLTNIELVYTLALNTYLHPVEQSNT